MQAFPFTSCTVHNTSHWTFFAVLGESDIVQNLIITNHDDRMQVREPSLVSRLRIERPVLLYLKTKKK